MSAHSSFIELSKSALQANIQFLLKAFPNVKVSSVVKANAYGHGLKEFVKMACCSGINHFSVFSSTEARLVHEALETDSDIMIMGWIHDNDFEWIVENNIEFFVFDLKRYRKAIETAKKLNIPARIHIEVETGMNRTGFQEREMDELFLRMKEDNDYYEFKGLCTHFAGAESVANYYRITNQTEKFHQQYDRFLANGFVPEKRHCACSAAALAYPDSRFDMVRVGILQYGFWPSQEILIQYFMKHDLKSDPLRRLLSWKSSVMTIKDVKKGEFVSYGTSYMALEDKRIAIVPIGYSGGYARNLSNQGRVLIHGQRTGVIGMVNMNMLIADISSIEDVEVGDEVVLIGQQGGMSISVASFSEISDQLNYELLTRLPSDIPRNIID